MKQGSTDLEFSDVFLVAVVGALRKRRRALKHSGKLFVEKEAGEDWEELTIAYESYRGLVLIAQFLDGNRANLYLRSNRRQDRGKVLFRAEGMRLVNNGPGIIAAFEQSTGATRTLRDLDAIDEMRENVDKLWSRLNMSVVSQRRDEAGM
jgi:hypothetical protein